jgi:hypothetical protein
MQMKGHAGGVANASGSLILTSRSSEKSFGFAEQFDCSGCTDFAEDVTEVTVSTETQPGRCASRTVVQRGPMSLDQA